MLCRQRSSCCCHCAGKVLSQPHHQALHHSLPCSPLSVLQVVERIVLEVELLLPLVRVALSCLAVDDLQLLQAQAVGRYASRPMWVCCNHTLLTARCVQVEGVRAATTLQLDACLLQDLTLCPWRFVCRPHGVGVQGVSPAAHHPG